MDSKFSKGYNETVQIVNSTFLPVLYGKLEKQLEFIETIKSTLKVYNNSLGENDKENNIIPVTSKIKFFNSEIYKSIQGKYKDNQFAGFDKIFSDFEENINKLISTIDEEVIEVQDPERFIIFNKDSFRLKLLKQTKKIFYKISQFPISFGNIFRKIFNKKIKPPREWHHKIPLRNLYVFYIKNELTSSLFSLIENSYSAISNSSAGLLKIFDSVNENFIEMLKNEEDDFQIKEISFEEELNKTITEIKNILQKLENDSSEKIKGAFDDLEKKALKAGTIELPRKRFNDKNIKEKEKKFNENYKKLESGWRNTLFILFDDWRFNNELYILRNLLTENYHLLPGNIHQAIEEMITPKIAQVKRIIERLRIDTIRNSGDNENLKGLIISQKEEVRNKLKKEFIPQLVELLYNQKLPEKVEDFNVKIKDSVNSISNKIAFTKGSDYSKTIKSSDIDFISPQEIINFEILPNFLKETAKLKTRLTSDLQKINDNILSLDQIFDFNMEAAIAAFDEKESSDTESKSVAVEGLDRIIGKITEISEQVENLEFTLEDYLQRANDDFNSNLMELTKTEKVTEIKLRIAKAMAMQKAADYKNEFIKNTKHLIPIFIENSKKIYKDFSVRYSSLRKKYGLSKSPASIASEISDFLVETQSTIDNLPFVYKRLFKIEPLTDDRFFILRDKSISTLKTAHNNWRKGRFAPTIIVGEKGSGKSTLINYFLKLQNKSTAVLHTSLKEAIYDKDKLLTFFGSLLNKNFKTFDEIEDYLNGLQGEQIIILENIQHLFLRRVGGFELLKTFFRLISRTNKKVFWIASSTLYSWHYLNKILTAADYFGYVITLESLTDKQIIEMILKRHSVSGYNIYFEASRENAEKKSFKKLSEDEKQEFLKKDYFQRLNDFAHNNLSLALLFWLRSTKEVSKDTITIGSLEIADFSFLSVLSQTKLFSLGSLLIHDGLTEEEHALIFNETVNQSRATLMLLTDDGIIIKEGDRYFVNPLLYRQIVSLLQLKNIVH